MVKRTKLATAIKLAALGAAGAAMLSATPTFAQDDINAIEEVMVTGSRIASAISDTPRPVTTVSLEDMQLSGYDTVGEYLRHSTYNTLGSYRDQSGSSFGSVALVDLKGLGPDRTAVLVNGRRVPGNPWTGTSAVDISTIPMAAIERVEILTDSASAVYGADAIGGVVNVIMKKNWEGVEISVGGSQPDRDDAKGENFSFTAGTASDKGSIVFSAEYAKKGTIYDRDRDFSKVKINSPAGVLPVDGSTDLQGINGGGNSAFSMDFSRALGPVGTCDYSGLTPVADPFGVPGTGCGYAYADFKAITRGYERRSTFLAGEYNINDDHKIFFENRYMNKEDLGVFAPAIGGFVVDETAPLNTFGEDFILYHRFVGHGTRDDSGASNELDTTIGLSGNLFNDEVNYEVYARDYRFEAAEIGYNYILTSVIEDLVTSGEYNFLNPFDEDNAGAIAASSATLSRDINTQFEGYGITLDGSMDSVQLAGGAIGWAAGWEYGRESYQDIYDSYREAGNVLGSAGNSSSGSRSRQAVFGEVELPVLDNLAINVAARFDDYDDVGSEFSPMLSGRYQPTDWLTIRASWGEGFKAPNLTAMYSELAQDFPQAPDLLRCRAQGIADNACPNSQLEQHTGGNPELQPETTESYNIGFVIEPLDSLSMSVDLWNITIDDVVQTLDTNDVLELERQGQLAPGMYVNRTPTVNGIPGNITRCEGNTQPLPFCGIVNVYGNLASREVQGLDFKINYGLETGIGSFDFDAVLSNIQKYDEELPIIGVIERAGTQGFPENRFNFGVRYSLDMVTVVYNYTWIDETESDYGGKFEQWDSHDLNFLYTAPFGTEFSFGIQNLTDEDPSIETATGWNTNTESVSTGLYSISGRVYSGNIRHRF
ncbi:TonB-dependent receptor [Simiduia curdlanivorans]|uniref:TonB-dependent receptor plug domain-containing protein n=1 Tax=Simiduia curdlanivorans TaxID=1492769 RepID=A0ABV8V8M1_9GAMM|nr:TonB-dependent receptor [Simiduia curdlanivorans]MDN3638892.1 TonB-dependent receptor [Simiduia curdlanivorans]